MADDILQLSQMGFYGSSNMFHVSYPMANVAGDAVQARCQASPAVDGLLPWASRFDQQRLELVAVTDPVVPPPCVRIPYPAILVGLLRELSVVLFICHCLGPTMTLTLRRSRR